MSNKTADEIFEELDFIKTIDSEEFVEYENLVERIKELEEENKKLKTARMKNNYGYENTYFLTKKDLTKIDTNKYLIEIEEGKFVDVKQLYLDSLDSIPVQKVNDEIEKYEYMLAETIHGEIQKYTPGEILLKIDTLKELLEEK